MPRIVVGAAGRAQARDAGRRRALALAALLGALLSACASLAPPSGERLYDGRFSLTADDGTRSDTSTGRFVLAVRGDGMTLDLSSPLGTTVARIDDSRGTARLIVPGRADDAAVDAGLDALTQRVLGWRLPVAGLPDWIRGLPAAGRPSRFLDDARRDAFEQDDWSIRVVERFGDDTPRRIDLDRPAGADGAPRMAVRLVLDGPPAGSEARR